MLRAMILNLSCAYPSACYIFSAYRPLPGPVQVSLTMGDAAFTGRYEPSRDGLDCVAIFDGTSFRLELLGASVKNLRQVEWEGCSGLPGMAAGCVGGH